MDQDIDKITTAVRSKQHLLQAIAEYEASTASKFVKVHTAHYDIKKCRVHWENHTAVPYVLAGYSRWHCEFGRNRYLTKKRLSQPEVKDTFKRKYNKVKGSKKIDCPAAIVAKHVIEFPQYQTSEILSKRRRTRINKLVLKTLDNSNIDWPSQVTYWLSLPPIQCHVGHKTIACSNRETLLVEIIHNTSPNDISDDQQQPYTIVEVNNNNINNKEEDFESENSLSSIMQIIDEIKSLSRGMSSQDMLHKTEEELGMILIDLQAESQLNSSEPAYLFSGPPSKKRHVSETYFTHESGNLFGLSNSKVNFKLHET